MEQVFCNVLCAAHIYGMVLGLIFAIGSVIVISFLFFFILGQREEEKKQTEFRSSDDVDYDGHGNYSRFPNNEKNS